MKPIMKLIANLIIACWYFHVKHDQSEHAKNRKEINEIYKMSEYPEIAGEPGEEETNPLGVDFLF